jgi:NAD-dependent dihydropyrimidine dehydrogenase PreA subunit
LHAIPPAGGYGAPKRICYQDRRVGGNLADGVVPIRGATRRAVAYDIGVTRATRGPRPASDPGCAGCAQLGTLRALRRAGLDVQGGLGCDPEAEAPFAPAPGRWAAVTGARRLLETGAPALLDEVAGAGARLLVLADRLAPNGAASLGRRLAAAGARVVRLDPSDLAGAEASARAAAEAPGGAPLALLAVAPCARRAPRAAPLAVEPARCNRCTACLSLACPALSYRGGESVELDPATCTGCGRCAPLCRSRALGWADGSARAIGP